jgi:hypothetical protein
MRKLNNRVFSGVVALSAAVGCSDSQVSEVSSQEAEKDLVSYSEITVFLDPIKYGGEIIQNGSVRDMTGAIGVAYVLERGEHPYLVKVGGEGLPFIGYGLDPEQDGTFNETGFYRNDLGASPQELELILKDASYMAMNNWTLLVPGKIERPKDYKPIQNN